MSLSEIISAEIEASGGISVARYMELALYHPEHGYYTKKDPFGMGGDFITAPEISQVFGEIIGAWCMDRWERMGSPQDFALIELGPGRGTLMFDILRVARLRSAFLKAADIYMVETSPLLAAFQHEKLAGHRISWKTSINGIPLKPSITIANEFFDALPIRQFVKGKERMVKKDGFSMPAEEGLTQEICEAAGPIMQQICRRGSAIIIDYGYETSPMASTLQAVKSHKYHNVLESPGEADITAHVDFGGLAAIARKAGAEAELTTQAEFLSACGVEARARAVSGKYPRVWQDVERLISPKQMGVLFKVLQVQGKFSF